MQNTRCTPKRQSCDRCHKQKLRCLRPSDGESGACERCTRLKTQCVYSSSLPKGRPRGQKGTVSVVQKSPELNKGGSTAAIHEHAAVDAQMITNVVQDSIDIDLWNDSLPLDWMDRIDNTFTDLEQWHFDLPSFGSSNRASSDNTAEPLFTPSDSVTNEPGAQINKSAIRADSHQNSLPKKAEPESAIATLTRLSQRLYSLYSAVLQLARCDRSSGHCDSSERSLC